MAFKLFKPLLDRRYWGSANLANTSFAIASTQLAGILPFYSFASGFVELVNFCQTKNKTALLSGLTLFSAGGFYSYQKWIGGLTNVSLLFIGLAISSGIETVDAFSTFVAESRKPRPNPKLIENARYTVWIKAFHCCGWAFLAAGNFPIGIAFLVCAAFFSLPQWLLSGIPSERPNNATGRPDPAANLPTGFQAFSGKGNRLGRPEENRGCSIS